MPEELMNSVTNNLFTVNNLWMMIATALVFIMHLDICLKLPCLFRWLC